jgi:hypothetical protein
MFRAHFNSLNVETSSSQDSKKDKKKNVKGLLLTVECG